MDRSEFEALYQDLLEHRRQPRIRLSSDSRLHNRCAAFEAIVAGGAASLPFLVERLEAGDFFLNEAMARITGLDRAAGDGEQQQARRWLAWWKAQPERGTRTDS